MYWEPGTQYNYGDIVEYEGHRYKIIQPHFSQTDWAPGPTTGAIWGRLSDQDPNCGGDSKQQQPCQQQQQPCQQQQPPYQQQQQQDQYNQQSPNQTNNPSNTEENKHWYGDEETKKKLEIGGGLLAGAALLGGGMLAFNKHKDNKEEAKADEWSRENWLQDARSRNNGGNEVASWVLTSGQKIPQGAILVGREKTWNLYICRSHHDGGLQLGKASEAFKNGGVLGYKDKEVFVQEYEVLVGDMTRLRWVSTSGKLNVASLGYRPFESGCKSLKGAPLYIVEAPYNNAVHPGKASEDIEGAFIAFGGVEKHVREYRVLCYNNNNNNNVPSNNSYNNAPPYSNTPSNNTPYHNTPYNNASHNTSYNNNPY